MGRGETEAESYLSRLRWAGHVLFSASLGCVREDAGVQGTVGIGQGLAGESRGHGCWPYPCSSDKQGQLTRAGWTSAVNI